MDFKALIEKSVKLYRNQRKYEVKVFGLKRELPVVKVSDNIWIASDSELVLSDVEFIKGAGKKIAKDIEGCNFDTILTAEAKAISISFKICEELGIKTFALARKSVKSYMDKFIFEEIKSITTSSKQILVLDEPNISKIKNKRIVIFDDVISTGGTIKGLINLARRLKAEIVKIVTIWLEGPKPFLSFADEIKKGKIIFYDVLPLIAKGEEYKKLIDEKKEALKRWS